jgi:hypothetical protein
MDAPVELMLWTAGSILLSALGGLLAWLAGQRPHSRLGELGASLSGNPFGRATLFLVRFAFYIGLPYVALMNHWLSPVVVGLVGTQTSDLPWWLLGWNTSEWVKALVGGSDLAGGVAVGALLPGGIAAAILLLGWRNAYRALGAAFPTGGLLPAPSIFVVVREGLFAEIHWAFYRAAPLAFIADPYWATLAGAALVILEWVLDPMWHTGLADGSRREALLMQLTWLALSASIFVLTRNVWPILVLHIALVWMVGRWVALFAARMPMVSQSGVADR